MSGVPDQQPWHLVDVEERARQHPGSFHLPALKEREDLHPGQYAKLVFEIVGPPKHGCTGERMWVKITKRETDYRRSPADFEVVETRAIYTGELDNEPSLIEGLAMGAKIKFLAANVAAWMP